MSSRGKLEPMPQRKVLVNLLTLFVRPFPIFRQFFFIAMKLASFLKELGSKLSPKMLYIIGPSMPH